MNLHTGMYNLKFINNYLPINPKINLFQRSNKPCVHTLIIRLKERKCCLHVTLLYNLSCMFYLGGVTLSGVETLLFPSIACPVITDPPLLSRNPFNLACIAAIFDEQNRMQLCTFIFFFCNSILSITFCHNQK